MSKSILQSIKPQYCELIAKGEKSIEVRKTRPKLDVPFKVYIYCTIPRGKEKGILLDPFHPNQPCIEKYLSKCRKRIGKQGTIFQDTIDLCGKVIGEYVCDKIIEYPAFQQMDAYIIPFLQQSLTCLTQKELWQYGKGKTLYGWHISDLKIYDKPKELSEFVKCNMPSFDDLDGSEVLCDYCTMTDFGERKTFGFAAGDYYDCGGEECKEAYKNYIEDNQYLTRPPQSWCYVEEV